MFQFVSVERPEEAEEYANQALNLTGKDNCLAGQVIGPNGGMF